MRLRMSTGRKPELLGCEAAISLAWDVALCYKAVPVNSYTARSILLASLADHGHGDLLSPHLSHKLAAPDPAKFMASAKWISVWLHSNGMSYRAVTGDPKDLPADHAEQQDASVKRIAGKGRLWEIAPSCIVFADETYLNFGQHQE